MKEYHLHKDDFAKLQLDIHQSKKYCLKNVEHCFKPHRHTFYQVIWFQSSGSHFVDYQEYAHEANSIFFLSEGQVHNFCPKSENEGYLFHFNDIFLNKYDKDAAIRIQYRLFNELGKPFIQIPKEREMEFQYVTNKLINEIESKSYNYREQLYFYFQILLLNIERLKQKEAIDFTNDPHFEMAMSFKKAVENNKSEFKNVGYFSQILGTTEKTLSTISKKYFRETPANFIHKKRVLEAKRLLSNSRLSIKEVSYELGFEQATYFTKYFKKHTKLTPKEFQRQFR